MHPANFLILPRINFVRNIFGNNFITSFPIILLNTFQFSWAISTPALHPTTLNHFQSYSAPPFLPTTLMKILILAPISSTSPISSLPTNFLLFPLCGPARLLSWSHTKTSLQIHHHLLPQLLILTPFSTTLFVVKSIVTSFVLFAHIHPFLSHGITATSYSPLLSVFPPFAPLAVRFHLPSLISRFHLPSCSIKLIFLPILPFH